MSKDIKNEYVFTRILLKYHKATRLYMIYNRNSQRIDSAFRKELTKILNND